MADKRGKQEAFIAERVQALATVHLTRRTDLRIISQAETIGSDLEVDVLRNEKSSFRRFRVALRGAWPAMTQRQANEFLKPAIASYSEKGPYPIPFCLFFFTMEDNQGYFIWIAEPRVTKSGRAKLQLHEGAACDILNRESLDTIVEHVNTWYDAFFAEIAV